MTLLEALILGMVQGAAEFLPISSSGHLVLVPWWLGWEEPPMIFDIAVHMGTAAAVLTHFWRDWLRLAGAAWRSIQKRAVTEPDERIFWLLVLGSIPAGIAGVLLGDLFESKLSDPPLVAGMLLVTAAILVASERLGGGQAPIEALAPKDALFIGVAQACAILPGISRAGSTIAGGLMRGLNRREAARYSFLLSLPPILGAWLLQMVDVAKGDIRIDSELGGALVVGTLAAAVVGYACITFLLGFIRRRRLYPFAIYCAVFGVISLLAWAL